MLLKTCLDAPQQGVLALPLCHDGGAAVQEALDFGGVYLVHIEPYQDIPGGALYAVKGEGVHHSSVYQRTPFPFHGFEHRRDGNGCPNGPEQRPLPENHLLSGKQVCSYGREGDGEVFNVYFRDKILDFPDHFLSFQKMVLADGHVHQDHHLHRVQAEEPFFEGLQAAGGVNAAHQRSGTGARHGSNIVPAGQQFLNGADIGKTTGTAAGED